MAHNEYLVSIRLDAKDQPTDIGTAMDILMADLIGRGLSVSPDLPAVVRFTLYAPEDLVTAHDAGGIAAAYLRSVLVSMPAGVVASDLSATYRDPIDWRVYTLLLANVSERAAQGGTDGTPAVG